MEHATIMQLCFDVIVVLTRNIQHEILEVYVFLILNCDIRRTGFSHIRGFVIKDEISEGGISSCIVTYTMVICAVLQKTTMLPGVWKQMSSVHKQCSK